MTHLATKLSVALTILTAFSVQARAELLNPAQMEEHLRQEKARVSPELHDFYWPPRQVQTGPPSPILCVMSAQTRWVYHHVSNVDAMERCKVPPVSYEMAINQLTAYRNERVRSPWTDNFCTRAPIGFDCTYENVTLTFNR